MKNNPHFQALVITSLGVLLISLESLFIKLTSIQPLVFSFYIGIFMFLSLNFILLTKKKTKIIQCYQNKFSIILICGFLLGVSNIFFISAIKTTTVANTVMIIASAPLFSALYSYLFYKEKSEKNIFIASFFIFLGLIVIFSSQLSGGNLVGNIYALICTNLFALGFVILARYKEINRLTITASAGICSAIVSFIFINSYAINTNALLILLLAGVLISPLARVLIGNGTKSLPASEVSLLMIIETIMAPIWVWLVLKEIPASSTFIGGAIILTTLVFNSLYVLKTNKQRVP